MTTITYELTPDGYFVTVTKISGLISATIHRPKPEHSVWRLRYANCDGDCAYLTGKSADTKTLKDIKDLMETHAGNFDGVPL